MGAGEGEGHVRECVGWLGMWGYRYVGNKREYVCVNACVCACVSVDSDWFWLTVTVEGQGLGHRFRSTLSLG